MRHGMMRIPHKNDGTPMDPRLADPFGGDYGDYVMVDTETTGLHPTRGDTIIEIGAVKVRGNRIVDAYSQLVNPLTPLDEVITRLTGITDGMLEGQPTIEQVVAEFDEWMGDCSLLAAHNAVFDMAFLDKAVRQTGIGRTFHHQYLDTLQMSRLLHPERMSHKVSALIVDYGIADIEQHRAESDARQEHELYQAMKEEARQRKLI